VISQVGLVNWLFIAKQLQLHQGFENLEILLCILLQKMHHSLSSPIHSTITILDLMAYSIYIIIEIHYCIMRGLNKSWR